MVAGGSGELFRPGMSKGGEQSHPSGDAGAGLVPAPALDQGAFAPRFGRKPAKRRGGVFDALSYFCGAVACDLAPSAAHEGNPG